MSISPKILESARGFSLLETLVAIVVLGSALIAISYFFSQARANIEAFGRNRSGLALAQDKMEALKDLPYGDADLAEGVHSDRVNPSGEPAPTDGVFFREWTVSPVVDDADGTGETIDYKLVDLRIYDQRLNLDPENSTPNDPTRLVARLKSYISP